MKGKRGNIIFFLILLLLFAVACYFLFLTLMDLHAEPVKFIQNQTIEEDKNQISFSEEFQFYPNMRFPSKSLEYNIDPSCNEEKITRIGQALKKVEDETNSIKFYPSDKNGAKIFFSCSESEEIIPGEYYIAGEGGPTSIINTSLFYIIDEGKVLLFYKKSDCDNYNVELHELLHVFGFKHSDNKKSIMYNTTLCDQVLTNDIVTELKRLYSIPPLPDLYMENISATKKGSYLDFDATVKNQGLKAAKKVVLELYSIEYSTDKKIEDYNFEAIDYGEGRILIARDITIPRKTTQIKFVVINKDNGEELDKSNNVVYLYLSP